MPLERSTVWLAIRSGTILPALAKWWFNPCEAPTRRETPGLRPLRGNGHECPWDAVAGGWHSFGDRFAGAGKPIPYSTNRVRSTPGPQLLGHPPLLIGPPPG